MRPFETIKSLRSAEVDGEGFLHTYLLHIYSLVKQSVESPALSLARQFVAAPGADDDALRELAKLRNRHPALAQITGPGLRQIHSLNSTQFGKAAQRLEVEVLTAVQESLESAVDSRRPRASRRASPGIAYQQLLDAAYDPAAALTIITNSMGSEVVHLQGAFHPVIFSMADTLKRPAMWNDPYDNFREQRTTKTGGIIGGIGDARRRMGFMKAPGFAFTQWIESEIAQYPPSASPQTGVQYGAMLHLLHQQLQQMR